MPLLVIRIEGKHQTKRNDLTVQATDLSYCYFEILKFGMLLRPTAFRGLKNIYILNLYLMNWLYEKRINVYIRKEIIKFVSRTFECKLNGA